MHDANKEKMSRCSTMIESKWVRITRQNGSIIEGRPIAYESYDESFSGEDEIYIENADGITNVKDSEISEWIMLKDIVEKIGMTIEEYAQRVHEYAKTITHEDDNPGPEELSVADKLTFEECVFMANYVTEHGL